MSAIALIGYTSFRLPSSREVLATHVVPAPRRLVWESHTQPVHLRCWLGPVGWSMTACEVDLRTGGAYRYLWERPAAEGQMEMRGAIRHVLALESLVSTECWGGGWPDTLNAMVLAEANGRTTIVHRILYATRRSRDAALAAGMRDSVTQSFARLDVHLASIVDHSRLVRDA